MASTKTFWLMPGCFWYDLDFILIKSSSIEESLSLLGKSESKPDSEQLLLVLSDLCFLLLVVWIHWHFLVIWITILLTCYVVEGFVMRKWNPYVGLLLLILTSNINILVLYLLVLLAIYLQIDIYPRFIYKLILFLNWI